MKAQESGWIINVTSRMGSLDDLDEWAPGYRLSKAALNVMTKMMAIELEGSGIRIHAVCPGWISTEMGGEEAPGTVDKPAEFITNLVLGLGTDPVSSISSPEIII
jgi:NAD(P)-dependent dehydrogenase (short-subunit alcohol dehydrogenase family)